MNFKTIPIFLAFFLMGLADAMGPRAGAVQKAYQLSSVMSTLLPFVVFIAFAVFSVPGGLLAARIGKKNLLLLGLGLNAAALAIPSYQAPPFVVLLACIFVLGVGTTFLQVAGNPIMRDVSSEGKYSSNLSFAQGIKGIGSTAATYLLAAIASLAFFKSMEWRAGFPLFCGLMILAFVSVALLRVKETKADAPPSIGTCLELLKEPVFLLAVLGIFLYVGAEVCMARFLQPLLEVIGFDDIVGRTAVWEWINGLHKKLDLKMPPSEFAPALFFLVLAIGRILGGAMLSFLSPRAFFRLSALLGMLGAAAFLLKSPTLAIIGIFAAGLGFANIWPMLFSITVEEKPERANELSGLMCMAISGGAIVPLVMGQLVDSGFKALAFIVPTACFAYLLLLSLRGGKATKTTT